MGKGTVVLVEFILAASAFQMFSGGSSVLGTITLLSAIAACDVSSRLRPSGRSQLLI